MQYSRCRVGSSSTATHRIADAVKYEQSLKHLNVIHVGEPDEKICSNHEELHDAIWTNP